MPINTPIGFSPESWQITMLYLVATKEARIEIYENEIISLNVCMAVFKYALVKACNEADLPEMVRTAELKHINSLSMGTLNQLYDDLIHCLDELL